MKVQKLNKVKVDEDRVMMKDMQFWIDGFKDAI